MRNIERYDEDFFNCYMAHVLSYFKHIEIPVELVLFKCMEPALRIYRSFIELQRDRWHFRSPYFDLGLLGARGVTEFIPTFDEAKPQMLKQLERGKVLFVTGDGYYIPHRLETYNKFKQAHNMMITGYRETDSGPQWYVEDHNRHPDFFGYYDEEIMRNFYDLAEYNYAHFINYFEFDEKQLAEPDTQRIYAQFTEYFDMYVDDFSTLDKLVAELAAHERDLTALPGGLELYERTFFFFASSRELFRRFAVAMTLGEVLEELLKQSIAHAFAIRAQIMRGNVTKKLDAAKVRESCRQLREAEEAILRLIQSKHLYSRNF